MTLFLLLFCQVFDSGAVGAQSQAVQVYVGGFPIGLTVRPSGVLVVAKVPIETSVGYAMPQTDIQPGDIITKVLGDDVACVSDVTDALAAADCSDTVRVTVRRNGGDVEAYGKLLKEDLTGCRRLGLAVKESVSGVGTVTFVCSDGRFGCLGHPICESETGVLLPCGSGDAYDCDIIGYNKGTRGKAGELKGVFRGSGVGKLVKNTPFGVFGYLSGYSGGQTVETLPRGSVRPGSAQIISSVTGKPELYDIEIIKASSQSAPAEKGMVIRVTDKRLLSQTGGILQGMSGSPILQNGKLAGAVTHVFLSDPSKGYGIYIDFMLSGGFST